MRKRPHILLLVLFAVALFGAAQAFIWPPFEIMRGDVNNDLKVDSADPIYLLSWLFLSGTPPLCIDAADINDDGQVDIADVSYLNAFIYGGGPAPPAPFPFCGEDPTEDGLSCGISACW